MAIQNLGMITNPDTSSDSPAIICPGVDGVERAFTYGVVRGASAALAKELIEKGLRRGERVAIMSLNRPEYLIAVLGTMQAGLVSVPINYKLPKEAITRILDDCGAVLLLGDEEHLAQAPNTIPNLSFDSEDFTDLGSVVESEAWSAGDVDPKDAAMILYTSGSTGRPKGVVLSHHSQLAAFAARVGSSAVNAGSALVAAPLYHMNGLMNSLSTLAQGGSVVLMPRFTAQSYIEAAVRYKVKALTAVPTMIALMVRERELLDKSDLSSVELVRIASAPLKQALIDGARSIFPAAVIVNGYGTTEGGAVTFGPHPDGIARPEISVGYPLPTVEWRLMRDGEQVEDEGSLEIRSGMTMSGYHNLPDATADAITEDGFYRTKDIFRRDEHGFFYFVGRSDDMFVCGGENIYPGEVETMLEQHPDIQQAAVVPVPDAVKGQKPVAFVVVTPGAATSEEHVKAFALATAPAYQHPRRVYFLDELPLAGTNKIDRHALLRLALAPISTGAAP